MKVLKAAQVTIQSPSIYHLAREVPSAHFRDTNDMFVLDTKWLLEDEREEAEKIVSILDTELGLESWREFELLYIYPD